MIKGEREYVIPATPGYEVLSPCVGEHGVDSLHRLPVIAWRVEVGTAPVGGTFAFAEPVCTEVMLAEYGILNPDGSVTVPECEYHASADDYLRSEIERDSKLRAARAKQKASA